VTESNIPRKQFTLLLSSPVEPHVGVVEGRAVRLESQTREEARGGFARSLPDPRGLGTVQPTRHTGGGGKPGEEGVRISRVEKGTRMIDG
jgi:hypothetical protein